MFGIAARNIARNKARTSLTFSAIFFGVVMTVLLSGFGDGLGTLMRNDVILSKVGALQVHRRGYADVRDSQPLDLDIEEGGSLAAKMRAVPGVRAVAPRLVFSGLVNNGHEATMFVARGLDAEAEYAVLQWARKDVEGDPIRRDKPTGGVLGYELAHAMGLKVGSTAILQAATKGGQQNALDLDVIGTLDNANAFEAKRFLHVPLAYAQNLLRMPGRVTEYAIGVEDLEQIDVVARDLRAALGSDYEVETWAQLQANVADVIRFQGIIVGLIAAVFLVIVVFGVVNTMVMSVMERTQEIGTMMALGLRRGRISVLFVQEAAVLALAGSLLGLAVAQGIEAIWIAKGGIAMAAPGQTVERYHILPVTSVQTMVLVLTAAVLGALVAAAYPAYKAAKLRPVEALRAT